MVSLDRGQDPGLASHVPPRALGQAVIGLDPGYLKVDCSSLKAAFRCFISSACFFLSSCSALISSSKRLDTLMACTWGERLSQVCRGLHTATCGCVLWGPF